jgi:hypothetical protein
MSTYEFMDHAAWMESSNAALNKRRGKRDALLPETLTPFQARVIVSEEHIHVWLVPDLAFFAGQRRNLFEAICMQCGKIESRMGWQWSMSRAKLNW